MYPVPLSMLCFQNLGFHYENTHIQTYSKFQRQKLKIFRYKNSDVFHISAQNIDCGYSLEPPRRGGSNEYPQSMFLSRNKKIIYTPVNPSFTIWKWGLRGSTLYRHVFGMLIILPMHFNTERNRPSAQKERWHSDIYIKAHRPIPLLTDISPTIDQ